MLPGFRILFGTVILSVSLLIFALGAAALLRSAHENFASQPNWLGSVDVAGPLPATSAPPSLAMLRVEPDLPKETVVKPAPEIAAPASTAPAVEPPAVAKAETPAITSSDIEQPPVAKTPSASPTAEVASSPAEAPAAEPVQKPSDPPVTDAAKAEPKQNKVAALVVPEESKPASTVTAVPAPSPAIETQTPALASTPQIEAALRDEPAASDQPLAAKKTEPSNASADSDDKPSEVAMLHEPLVPLSEIKLPKPRIDPQIMRAQRQQRIIADRRAQARAVARRAAARARATPFGQPAQTSNNSFQTMQQPYTQTR